MDEFQIGVRCVMGRFLDGFLDACWIGVRWVFRWVQDPLDE